MTAKEIIKDRKVLGGVPVFKGTRTPVAQVFSLRSAGMTEREIVESFAITKKQISAAYKYAAIELNGKKNS